MPGFRLGVPGHDDKSFLARVFKVRAGISGVWARLSGVQEKIYVTATYSASESAKNVLKWGITL